MARKRIDLSGQRFGRLVVVEFSHSMGVGVSVWLCKCDCGNSTPATTNHLRMKQTKSCGCLNTERRAELCKSRSTHGHATKGKQSVTYVAWVNMLKRCKPDSSDAVHYFDRGIGVCERWRGDFTAFLADMGERPKGATLDRIDNNLGYAPGNCRWTDWRTQQNNRRGNRMLVIHGEGMTMSQAAERFGINYNTLRSRIYIQGKTAEEAVSCTTNRTE